jgi:hypothetical protein
MLRHKIRSNNSIITSVAFVGIWFVAYKFGFSVGFSDYNHRFDNDADALDCSPPDNNAPLQVCVNNPVAPRFPCGDGPYSIIKGQTICTPA